MKLRSLETDGLHVTKVSMPFRKGSKYQVNVTYSHPSEGEFKRPLEVNKENSRELYELYYEFLERKVR